MAQATEPRPSTAPAGGGFQQSPRRTLVELGAAALVLVLLFFVGRGCLGWGAERAAENLPPSADARIGKQAAEQFRAQYAGAAEKVKPAQEARVRKVFDELREELTEGEAAILIAPRVTVVYAPEPNAFALPGGEVFVFTGLLDRLGEDDDALRGVLAHELGHAVGRHGVRLVARRAAFAVVLAAIVGDVDGLVVALAAGAADLEGRSHSREMERDADAFAVELLARTGHSSDGLVRFLEGLGAQPVPLLLSTHPDPQDRARAITAGDAAAK